MSIKTHRIADYTELQSVRKPLDQTLGNSLVGQIEKTKFIECEIETFE